LHPALLVRQISPRGGFFQDDGMSIDSSRERILCRLEDIPDGRSRGFLPVNRDDRLFVVRRGQHIHAYINSCPHNWRPLDYAQDQFLSANGSEIVCYAHGAHFSIDSGECIAGVCMGQALIAVPARVDNGMILIPLELPQAPE
jgi:nitrite reductase/ring-hydroxylating ferredoxin subunit